MKAMRLLARGAPLATCEVRLPPPEGEQLLIGVEACGVCRTDLHLVDDELPGIGTPITPVEATATEAGSLSPAASAAASALVAGSRARRSQR